MVFMTEEELRESDRVNADFYQEVLSEMYGEQDPAPTD